jgi:hypothetical protein
MQLANQSQIAEQALGQIAQIYAVEPEVKDLNAKDRLRIRQDKSLPLVQTLHDWLMLNRQKGPEGSATAKGINYSLRRWKALTRFLQDGPLPVDNNWIENQIRPIAIGRNNCLFASSLRGGQRAAAVMSLIQSAKLNGHDAHEQPGLRTCRQDACGHGHRWDTPQAVDGCYGNQPGQGPLDDH